MSTDIKCEQLHAMTVLLQKDRRTTTSKNVINNKGAKKNGE